MPERVRVVVSGAAGKMGREICAAVARDPELELVGGIDIAPPPAGSALPWSADPFALVRSVRPRVVVDFSTASATLGVVHAALEAGASPVVGTSGLTEAMVAEIRDAAAARGVGAAVVPNFALGAVLMMHFAAIAARYFDAVEVIEAHHETKQDAPSGTALATAQHMVAARGREFLRAIPEKETILGSRGAHYAGVSIHSLRLPGVVARQEVIFGALGQYLTIAHDTTSREAYLPGVMLAIKAIVGRNDFVYGLAPLLGLGS
ncbi:MAG: 4-hydroxy-tetrahydrodipicolinate reductase [Chloroflexota bacterium]|nr:4-hydroxy-tetrahydrodipicolinate reductase [Dehalococcoidia bacterium]MDW8253106.1 4-hydroxy-tetrahydrodipicolinate reductase [Chloroflexota bacterium]